MNNRRNQGTSKFNFHKKSNTKLIGQLDNDPNYFTKSMNRRRENTMNLSDKSDYTEADTQGSKKTQKIRNNKIILRSIASKSSVNKLKIRMKNASTDGSTMYKNSSK